MATIAHSSPRRHTVSRQPHVWYKLVKVNYLALIKRSITCPQVISAVLSRHCLPRFHLLLFGISFTLHSLVCTEHFVCTAQSYLLAFCHWPLNKEEQNLLYFLSTLLAGLFYPVQLTPKYVRFLWMLINRGKEKCEIQVAIFCSFP